MSGSKPPFEIAILPRWKRIGLAAWFLTTLALGTAGYLAYGVGHEPISRCTALYHTAQLFLLHAPHFDQPVNWMLEVARWSAALFTAGAVYEVAKQLFHEEFLAWRLFRVSDHLIVCGLGRRGLQCVHAEGRKPSEARRRVVVIDRSPPPDMLVAAGRMGAQVVVGDATDPRVLRQAGIDRAAELYALTAEDSVNCEAAVQAWRILENVPARTPPFTCNVHLGDLDLRTELQRYAVDLIGGERTELRFFDLFDVEARRVLLEDLPIDHDGVGSANPRRVHLVILGLGRMGRALAVRAAKLGHFANGAMDPRLRLRISVVDRAPLRCEDALLFRYPQFRQACDLEIHQQDVESVAARNLVEGWCADPGSLTSIAVCFDEEPRALELALKLFPAAESHGVRVAVRLARRTGLASLLERIRTDRAGKSSLRPFGMLEEGCCEQAFMETAHERMAVRIHADFVDRRTRDGRNPKTDGALAPWAKLGERYRESNRQQADHIPIKLRAIGCRAVAETVVAPAVAAFDLEEVELLARMEHDRWNAEKWLSGWTAAPGDKEKDEERRTSPYMVSWEELGDGIRQYDRDSVKLIPELFRGTGLKVCRVRDLA